MLVCGVLVTTSGLQGLSLGSDESEIILLSYAIVDSDTNQVRGIQEYIVKPDKCEALTLSQEVLDETRLSETAIYTSGVPLSKALSLFASYCSNLGVSPYSLCLLTDGQLPFRQVLHPQAAAKDLALPSYYNDFADLRKSIASMYSSDTVFTSIPEILTFLDIPNSEDTTYYSKQLRDMVNIIQRVIIDGHKFVANETIQVYLEPGICSREEEVDSACVVRARGLPWQSSDQDIARFFRGLNIAKGGVALCLSPLGRRNGEALVRFTSGEHREMALKRHKHHIGSRYIEVYRATGEEFVNVAGGSNNEAQSFLTRGAQVIIRMRGLPYDCTAKQVLDFFESGPNGCAVMCGEEGVLFVRKPDGRSTGDAFVLFASENDAPKALSKHRESIGVRYIELFRSTTAEVQQVLNRTLEPVTVTVTPNQAGGLGGVSGHLVGGVGPADLSGALAAAAQVGANPLLASAASLGPLLAPLPSVPLLPQHIITSGTRKDCIRLRGLPYEAQVEHILEFLGEHAKSILFQGVHMVYNSQGQPSGEAFIQMDSEQSAASAASLRHHKYINFGKKQRYIEVWQCSGEDMSLVLSGQQISPSGGGGGGLAGVQPPPVVGSPPPTQQPPPPPQPQPVQQLTGGDCVRWGDYILPGHMQYPVMTPVSPPPLLILASPFQEGWGIDPQGNVQPFPPLHTSA